MVNQDKDNRLRDLESGTPPFDFAETLFQFRIDGVLPADEAAADAMLAACRSSIMCRRTMGGSTTDDEVKQRLALLERCMSSDPPIRSAARAALQEDVRDRGRRGCKWFF